MAAFSALRSVRLGSDPLALVHSLHHLSVLSLRHSVAEYINLGRWRACVVLESGHVGEHHVGKVRNDLADSVSSSHCEAAAALTRERSGVGTLAPHASESRPSWPP
jgi:hypothetical protein